MQRPHNELFATLHQLASTFTTVFEVLAEVRPEDRHAEPRPTPTSAPEEPTPPPTPKAPPKDTCIACGDVCDEVSAQMKAGRLCWTCISASLDNLRRQRERARLESIAGDIRDHFAVFDRLIAEAVDGDGARSLPILGAEVSRLLDLFRTRSGSFADEPAAASGGKQTSIDDPPGTELS